MAKLERDNNLSIAGKLIELRDKIACKLLPTSELEELRAELEQGIQDAENGEFDDNEFMLTESTKELEKTNKELARRQRRAS